MPQHGPLGLTFAFYSAALRPWMNSSHLFKKASLVSSQSCSTPFKSLPLIHRRTLVKARSSSNHYRSSAMAQNPPSVKRTSTRESRPEVDSLTGAFDSLQIHSQQNNNSNNYRRGGRGGYNNQWSQGGRINTRGGSGSGSGSGSGRYPPRDSPPISPNGAASVYYNEETKTFFPTNPIRSITPSYLTVAAQEPSALASPQKLLVILDLNGTLFYRNKNNKRNVTSRPYLQEFLDFIFESCRVMVWSSAQPHSVETMLSYGFDQRSSLLDRVWTREDFRLPRSDYIKKVLTIKDLEFVWEGIELEKKRAREGKRRSQQQIFSKEEKIAETVASLEVLDEKYSIHFDQTNTVLIDDSHDKSQLQPHNCLVLRDFDENLARAGNDDELLRVKQYLQKLVYQSNVSAYMSRQPYDSNALLEDPAPRKLANRRSSTKDHFVIVDPVADHLK